MNFEQFRRSGRKVDDLGKITRDPILAGIPGKIYDRGQYYLEKHPDGNWYVIINGQDYQSSDLWRMEWLLYRYRRLVWERTSQTVR